MSEEFMFTTFILFLAGVIAVPLASRLGLGSVLGYLIAGIVIGPILQWSNVDIISLQHFTEFGVVMMLFLIGLETQPKVLWDMRARIFVMGGLQVALTAAFVMLVSLLLQLPWSVSLAIGLIFALSSTAIVNQTLSEKGLLRSDGGRASFSVLLFQDIAVIPMLALFPLLAMPELLLASQSGVEASHGEPGLNLSLVEGLPGWMNVLVTFAAVVSVILIGHYLTGPIFRHVSRARLRELFVSTALMMVIGIALFMSMVGLSPALGTFIAGVVMADSEYRHELESNIAPFKGIFLGIFFITVGANIDFALLAENLTLVIGLTFGLIVLKSSVMLAIARQFKLMDSDKWLFAIGLAQAGEFGFVLISFAVSHAIIPSALASLLLLIVTLSMLVTPVLFIVYDRVIAPRYSKKQEQQEADDITSDAHIIIAGFGRFGGVVNRSLQAAGYETTVVDYSNDQLEMVRKFGFHAYFGDATRPDLLQAAGIENAKILVIAINDKQAITELARYITTHYPQVHIVARAIDRRHVYDLWSVGCRDIIRETYDSSIRASRSAFEALGLPREKAERLTKTFEEFDRSIMVKLAEFYEVGDPLSENSAFLTHVRENQNDWDTQLQTKMKKVLES